ncbi:MAG: TIM barrel protein [Paracoccaceae bacterium]|nr:TIM barrel protein [Paracoccaceae bacterium]
MTRRREERRMRFSANLGFLWANRPLPDAVHAAKAAGFSAVECHWPYDTPAATLRSALTETGLPFLSLNTRRGTLARGEFGLAAVPFRQTEAQESIQEAIDYADKVGARAVHVMAGKARGSVARKTFLDNLDFATAMAEPLGITILIEPINRHDAPGYFLETTGQALQVIDEVAAPNLRLMFDCYHIGRTEGDPTTRFAALQSVIGHVQFASVPDRGPPDRGDVDYATVFAAIAALGWNTPLGAEYNPVGPTGDSLGWMTPYLQSVSPD